MIGPDCAVMCNSINAHTEHPRDWSIYFRLFFVIQSIYSFLSSEHCEAKLSAKEKEVHVCINSSSGDSEWRNH